MVAFPKSLGQAVLAERARRGWTQADVVARRGPSDTILSKMEAGEWSSRAPAKTLAKLDDAFGWPEGTALRVYLEGFDPQSEAVADHEPTALERRLAMLERRLSAMESAFPYKPTDDELAEFEAWRQQQAASRGRSKGKGQAEEHGAAEGA